MKNVVVAENHLKFGGISYFRAHAEEVEIGSIGEKRQPFFKQNYLEVKDRVQVPEKNIVQATVVEIDFTKTKKRAFKAKAEAIVEGVPVEVDGGFVFEKLRSGELKLVKFSISNNDMKKAINASPEQLHELIHWGKQSRVALQVFIVIEATLANKFSSSAIVGLSAGVEGLQASIGMDIGSSGTMTVKLSRGSCFAYLLGKLEWDDNQKVVDIDDDQWGMA